MPSFAGNQLSASGSAVDRPHLRSSSSPSLLSKSRRIEDIGVTGRGVLGVASQSLPSVRQLSGAATGVFSGEAVCSGGTPGGLTVFVDVGAGAFAGLGLGTSDGGFVVGLHSEVGVTGASGAGALEAAMNSRPGRGFHPCWGLGQPASVSERCLLACDGGASCGLARLCCGAEHADRTPRAYKKAGN